MLVVVGTADFENHLSGANVPSGCGIAGTPCLVPPNAGTTAFRAPAATLRPRIIQLALKLLFQGKRRPDQMRRTHAVDLTIRALTSALSGHRVSTIVTRLRPGCGRRDPSIAAHANRGDRGQRNGRRCCALRSQNNSQTADEDYSLRLSALHHFLSGPDQHRICGADDE